MRLDDLEIMLTGYYTDLKNEWYYKQKLDNLNKELDIIGERIKNRDFSVEYKIKSIEYNSKVQVGNAKSNVEAAIIEGEKSLTDSYWNIKREIFEIDKKLREIDRNKISIGGALSIIDSKYKDILNKAYNQKLKVPKDKRLNALKELQRRSILF